MLEIVPSMQSFSLTQLLDVILYACIVLQLYNCPVGP